MREELAACFLGCIQWCEVINLKSFQGDLFNCTPAISVEGFREESEKRVLGSHYKPNFSFLF